MTIPQFHALISKPRAACEGWELRMRNRWEQNDANFTHAPKIVVL